MMKKLEETYQKLLEEAESNTDIVGLVLGGSRGKDDSYITDNSDYDVIVVVSDTASEKLIKDLRLYGSEKFEIWPKTLTNFEGHASWGTPLDWDRYNYTHNKAIIDKTGDIQSIIDEKGIIPKESQKAFIEDALESYINLVYRSAKYWRDGYDFAARLDASESLPYLMTILYALEYRVRPYNKYFEWELKNHPLKYFPWPIDEFIADYKTILTTGDIKIQEKIFTVVKKLFIEHGYSTTIDEWKGKYFVG